MLTIGSLCSGYGGLDLAVEQASGARTVWHAEIDPDAARVLAAHWPGVPNYSDLTAADWSAVEPVDVLTAGWPCQPWSLAGKRNGADDARAIWPAIAHAVRMVRPRYVLLENVPGIVTAGELARATADLAACGYVGSWRCVRAADVGAPHRRERVFILAADSERGGLPRWTSDPIRGPGRRAAAARGGSDAGGSDGVALLPTPDATHGRKYTRTGPLLPGVVELLPTPTVQHTARNATAVRHDLRPTTSTTGWTLADVAYADRWGDYAPAITRWERVTDRPAPNPTEPNRDGRQRLSPRFVEWLMGLSPGHVTDHVGRTAALRILGNGVVPQQAVYALSLLLSAGVTDAA